MVNKACFVLQKKHVWPWGTCENIVSEMTSFVSTWTLNSVYCYYCRILCYGILSKPVDMTTAVNISDEEPAYDVTEHWFDVVKLVLCGNQVQCSISCRTALTRRHWTFYVWTLTDWCANASALETILGPRVLCVDVLYKLTFTLLTYLLIEAMVCKSTDKCNGVCVSCQRFSMYLVFCLHKFDTDTHFLYLKYWYKILVKMYLDTRYMILFVFEIRIKILVSKI